MSDPNPVFEAVRTVLAVREFRDEEVPEDVVRRILESARLTASGGNGQAWHFILVRDRSALRELGSLVRTAPYIASAAAAIVVGIERDNAIAVADAGRAVQSMVLNAWAEGVGSNWAGFASLEAVRERWGFPDSYRVVAVLPLGYPRRRLGRGRKKRKPFAEVVSSERFGTPLS